MLLKYTLIICAFIASYEQPAQPQGLLNPGRYTGMEYMGINDVTPDDRTDKWHYENTIIVKGDAILLKKVPVVFYKDQVKRYSASDGGFYSYPGEVYRNGKALVVSMKMTSTDNGAFDKSVFYKKIILRKDGFIMGGVYYRRF